MYTFSYHAIAPFVSHILSIAVFAFLYFKNPRSSQHITLGLFCLGASLWQFATGMMFIATTDALALFWDRVVYVGVNFQWVMHFHFTVLLIKAKGQRWWLLFADLIAAFFAIFTPTDYFVHDVYRYSWGCHSIAGPLHHPFVLISTAFYMKCLVMIFRRFQVTESAVEKNQYKYYMAGFTIFVSASLAYLPAYQIAVYPFAYWFASIYCIILGFIIVRHHMLDIETVIHKTLLWLTISLAMIVPIAAITYTVYPVLVKLDARLFTAAVVVLIAAAIGLFSAIQPRIDHKFQRRKYDYRNIIDQFMGVVATLNDREKLTRATKDVLSNTLYPEDVRIFWVEDGTMRELNSPAEIQPLQLHPSVAAYMAEHNDVIERDVVPVDPKFRDVRQQLMELINTTRSSILLPVTHEQRVHAIVAMARKSNLATYTALDRKFLREIAIGMSLAGIHALVFETQKELLEKEREARKAQEDLVRIRDEMNAELERKVSERTEELSTAIAELNVTNGALVATRDALWGEMQLAKKLQSVLLPKNPHMSGFELVTYMNPASEVGGDYYDVLNTECGDWLIIGDVSGHGVTAGLVMMMVQTAVHTALSRNAALQPKELLSIVNDTLMQNVLRMGEDKYVTVMALSRSTNGLFRFSGLHQDILLYRKRTQTVEVIPTSGMWLGIWSPVDDLLDQNEFTMEVGDVLMLYSDGIVESVRQDPGAGEPRSTDDLFGKGRLCTILAERRTSSISEIKSRLVAEVARYRCNDDVTFVLAERTV